uniref:Auxin-responsive protein n=1 Tax=Phyllostachys edulis TaxID=38705 RepID=A0A1D8F0I0_PHYED|nr:AUX4 protein [Phyllostachys edulis]
MENDAENLCATELRLGPPGSSGGGDQPMTKKPSSVGAKRALDDTKNEASGTGQAAGDDQDITTAAKAQVVGWPPVRAYRRNTFQAAAKKAEQQQGGLYVKVSMDGAPYLRKVDLRMYKGYKELREALDVLFIKCFSASASAIGAHAADGCGDQFAIAYEDKDGDLMLVGDVPWDMFISSCKKLRIMKGSEAR